MLISEAFLDQNRLPTVSCRKGCWSALSQSLTREGMKYCFEAAKNQIPFKLGLGRISGNAGLSGRISDIPQKKPDCLALSSIWPDIQQEKPDPAET